MLLQIRILPSESWAKYVHSEGIFCKQGGESKHHLVEQQQLELHLKVRHSG